MMSTVNQLAAVFCDQNIRETEVFFSLEVRRQVSCS
jgi:hypothetical protein